MACVWAVGNGTIDGDYWAAADELWRHVRDQSDFATWLQRNTMDGVLTRGQKASQANAVTQMLSYVDQAATTFIEAGGVHRFGHLAI